MKTEPTEAYREIEGTKWFDDFSAMNLCKIAFSEGQSNPKIKELEWEDEPDFAGCIAKAFFTVYGVRYDKQNETYYVLSRLKKGVISENIISINEAKAAAQEDFETKVKECLNI